MLSGCFFNSVPALTLPLGYNVEQYSNSYLLNSVDSSHQVISRYRASDDLKRNPIIANEESGGDAHHRVFIQGGLRNFFWNVDASIAFEWLSNN